MIQFTENGLNIVMPLESTDMLPLIQNGLISYLRSTVTKNTEGMVDDEAIYSLCEVLKATLLEGEQLAELVQAAEKARRLEEDLADLRTDYHRLKKTA